jgi:hypothetical protein
MWIKVMIIESCMPKKVNLTKNVRKCQSLERGKRHCCMDMAAV